MQLPIAGLDKRYTCGSGRDMRRSDLPTTGFIAVVFIMLPNNRFYRIITFYLKHLPETQVNRVNIPNIPVVKNRGFMRNKGHVFGVRTFTDSKNTL